MVYVDHAAIKYGRMKLNHMMADTVEELHAMADKLGLKREWFQEKSTPHYDICLAKRELALKLGAQEMSREKCVELIRKYRLEKGTAPSQTI